MQSETCLVVAFHGSRLPRTREKALALVHNLQQASSARAVRVGFLTMCQPSLLDILRGTGGEGFGQVDVWPLFTLPGTHTETDIPGIVADCRREFPKTTYRVWPCLGDDASFLDWLVSRAGTPTSIAGT